MSVPLRRSAAASFTRVLTALAAILLLSTPFARAVIVRGTVTDPLGATVAGARVQLIQGQTVAAFAFTGADGSFEIRSTAPGRFLLLTSARTFTPNIGQNFYGGRTDIVTRNVTLEIAAVTTAVTVTATGIPTPIQQVSSPVTLIPFSDLATRVGIVDDLRQSPGVAAVQSGQYGGATSLFVRGGNSTANKVLVDGITAEDIGGVFDFGNVASTALAGIEFYRGPNSVLYGSDAGASVVSLNTPRGSALRPVLNYSGDAGNFHTYRNEVTLSGAHNRLDYYGAFSRFDSSNAIPQDKFHAATSAVNLGYNLTANTQARFTLRNAVSAIGVPGPRDFFALSNVGKQGDQDIYSGLTLENRTLEGRWHNLVRYGIARKREQAFQFYPVGYVTDDGFGDLTYYGDTVTIRGANGYSATGRAAMGYGDIYPTRQDQVSNRDELYYQSDYTFSRHLTALLGFRYEDERGAFVSTGFFPSDRKIQRTNFQYTLQFQGDIKNRLFYSLGGAVERNHLYGTAGTPRIGLAYVPVRPGSRFFRGTKLRANFATGVQEPSLLIQFNSLYGQLLDAGNTAAIDAYHVKPINALRSRTYDFGIDQNIFGQKLILKAGYFHNIFDHQIDYIDKGTLQNVFGIQSSVAKLYGAELNTLAFRAQGLETELQFQPVTRIFLRGGYTYLASVVLQSFSTDAVANGTAATNPNLPGVPIGSSYPLIGARPFRRPPHTGFFAVQYAGSKFSAALKGNMVSRSDDSTFLTYSDFNGGNTLLLPNHDLDFGYTRLDANLLYTVNHHVTAFTQLDNLLGQQHTGPIGYPGLPFTFRAGLKLRIGGN
ncbi:MAG: TonB-dependent receptor [Acidobacteriales bacterium 59-55]|nr:TonB-dependent receptor [Terriglobales bacterium]OJV41410.1 MAG: TonB-dependent receptor [Acidobacteriales bacterium 59-55]